MFNINVYKYVTQAGLSGNVPDVSVLSKPLAHVWDFFVGHQNGD